MSEQEKYEEEDIATAGEYVLLLLGPEEAAAFEARLSDEPPLRQLVVDWQEGLATLADEVEEIPPAALWARIEAEAFGTAGQASGAATDTRRGWWTGWLAGALAAAAIAVVAALFFFPAGPGPATHQAEIAAEDRSLVVQAALSSDGQLTVTREEGGPAPGRALELWLIADGADAPVSLGVLPEAAEARFDVPEDLIAAFTGGTLAISDEPPGGSPTGAPTGDVLAAAAVQDL